MFYTCLPFVPREGVCIPACNGAGRVVVCIPACNEAGRGGVHPRMQWGRQREGVHPRMQWGRWGWCVSQHAMGQAGAVCIVESRMQ